MRYLFILRGAPASGKSTWIKENELDSYTISTDTLRLMYQSPVTNTDGTRAISQNNDKDVWQMVMDLMERRMQNGELIVVDATHYKAPLINKYKDLVAKYRYRVYVVDFSNVSEEELKRRNALRGFRRVPDEVIEKMVVALADSSEVKKAYNIISPKEAAELIKAPLKPFDANEYERVVIFGDIHGCYDPLKEYFDKNPFNEKYNYIFCGDYLDRGLQNKEVLEFLIQLKDHKNVAFLEGNHEQWLRIYSQKDYDMDYYENRPISYRDPFVTKVISQLKERYATIEKKIKNNNCKSEELSKLLRTAWETNPEAREVYYEFELVNVPETQKQLHKEIGKYESQLEQLQRFINVLQHEEHNTKDYINTICDWFKEQFNCSIGLDITNILQKNYSVTPNRVDNPIKSLEFIKHTYPQIKDIDKTQIRRFCDRLAQMSYFTFNCHDYLVTHGGLPCLPDMKTPSIEMIKGVGKYEQHEEIDKQFNKNEEENKTWTVQIHGHRNVMNVPIISNENMTFNLEGKVEFGGHLRIVELGKPGEFSVFNDGHWRTLEIKNNNFIPEEQEVKIEEKEPIEILKEMYRSPLIQVKELQDNIISLNFTREAFEHGRWNPLTCTARGLFVDKTNGNIAAISYSKFFNKNEQDCTKPAALKENLKYPLVGYRKENGFLGLISKYNGQIRFFTKSSDSGDYVNWFIGVLCDTYGITCNPTTRVANLTHYSDIYNHMNKRILDADKIPSKALLQGLRRLLQEHLMSTIEEGKTYIFECVDQVNDPHIIKYDKNDCYLLDVKNNNFKDEYMSYDELCKVAEKLNVPVKTKELVFNNWEEFDEWRHKFSEGITQWDCKHEGYVFEDANGFRVKYKSSFYSFWKQMRALKEKIQNSRQNLKVYKTKGEIQVVKLLESIDKEELKKLSIIDIEDKFYENYGG